jgi:hypothetical protein
MSAPFVSGIAALVFSVNQNLSAVDVRTIIVSTSRQVSSALPDGSRSMIRIPDAAAAMILASTYTPTPFGVSQKPSSPTYQSPKADHAAPEFIETSSSSSCALRRNTEPNLFHLLFFALPLTATLVLRKRRPHAQMAD